MIYQFNSRATGSVSVSPGIAELMLEAISHPISPTGVITVEQMPAAISVLKQLKKGKDSAAAVAEHTDSFIRMLEKSLAGDKAVTWGV